MNSTASPARRWPDYALLVVFLAGVIGAGAFIGINTAPGAWYASLEKPPFNPPSWVFSPVWFALYVCIAIAGWRTAMQAPSSTAMRLWFAQMLLNWAWSPTFFSLRLLWPAGAIIIVLLGLITWFIIDRWRGSDHVSALLFVPYAMWVAFATSLNLSIAILN